MMLCLEFQEYFSYKFCPLVLGSVLTSEVTGIGLAFSPLFYVLYTPQAAFSGCRRVLYFSSMLLQPSQTPKLPLPSWAGSRASHIPMLVVLSFMKRLSVPLHLESSGGLLVWSPLAAVLLGVAAVTAMAQLCRAGVRCCEW